MNRLEITGKILWDPIFVIGEAGQPRTIKLTIKWTDKRARPEMYLKLDCVWESPPNRYWMHQDLQIGTLVHLWGPLFSGFSNIAAPSKSKCPYLDIKFFEIRTTAADFQRMTKRAGEKDHKK